MVAESIAPWSTVTQHCTRPCGGKVAFGSGSLIRIGSGSKFPCGEHNCQDDTTMKLYKRSILIFVIYAIIYLILLFD